MANISIVIDISAQEIIAIANALRSDTIGVDDSLAKVQDLLNQVQELKTTPPAKRQVLTPSKKVMMNPVKKSKKTSRRTKPRKWKRMELRWLTTYAKENPINKKIVTAFVREFGYKRSFSSLANKAYECRRRG